MAGEPVESGGGAAETVPTPSLDPSTNWDIVDGSLRRSIAFDTSSSFDSDDPTGGGVSSAKGAVFLRSPYEESGPCEINICFRQRHDIHRVYVRSSARVYEIYHALEQPFQSNEYLCTVHCGKASTEVSSPEIDEEKLPMEQCSINQASINVPKISDLKSNNNGNDEDGWIEVKVPDSPVLIEKNEVPRKNVDGKIISKAQACYEATAEISDLRPCTSLTVRLLSLQPKGHVYIEEIYIYADPFESETSSSKPSTSLESSLGGTSLLSMLVPGLLELSKSGNSKLKDKGISGRHENRIAKETEKINTDIGRDVLRETYFTEKKFIKVHEESPIHACSRNANSGSCQEGPSGHMDNQNYTVYGRIEQVLEELLSRVGKIETFCSSFEEKVATPLLSIVMKLQTVEQQLAVLTERTNHSRPLRPSRISAPEFTCDESDFENRDHDAPATSEQNCRSNMPTSDDLNACKMCPVLVVRAPEFVQDDTPCCSQTMSSVRENLPDDKRSSHVMLECNQESESNVICDESTDLERGRNTDDKASTFSAPEFSSKDDSPIGDNASAPTEKSHPKDGSAFSIDTVLASALEALLSSTTKYPECNEDGKNNIHPVTEVPLEHAESSYVFHFEKKRENEILELVSDMSTPPQVIDMPDNNDGTVSEIVDQREDNHQSPIAAPNHIRSKDWPSVFFVNWHFPSEASDAQNDDQLPMCTVGETHDNQLPTADVEGICDTLKNTPNFGLDIGVSLADSESDETDQHQIPKQWFGESSTESVADGLNLDSCHVGWSDLSSSDSVEVKFPLPSWLTGRSSDCKFLTEEDFDGIKVDAASDPLSPTLMNPKVGIEPEREFNSLLDFQHPILDFEGSPVGNRSSNSMFKDFLREMSDIEVQVSDCKDDARETEGGLLNSPQYCADVGNSYSMVTNQSLINMEGEFQYDADGSGSSIDANQPLVDVEDTFSNTKALSIEGQEHSPSMQTDQQPSFSSLI